MPKTCTGHDIALALKEMLEDCAEVHDIAIDNFNSLSLIIDMPECEGVFECEVWIKNVSPHS